MGISDVVVTRQERDNALEAHEILDIIVQKLNDHSSATTIEIETELVLRIRLCAAFRQRLVRRQNTDEDRET